LPLCSLLEGPITKDLEIDEAGADSTAPKNEEAGKEVEAEARAVARCAGHRFSQTNMAAG